MNTDAELLLLAAKAAGLPVKWHESGYYGPTMEIMEDEAGGPAWNPLTDDGDALRLAVTLRMQVDVCGFVVNVSGRRLPYGDEIPATRDKFAATRRAIVRAAAEIGRAIP